MNQATTPRSGADSTLRTYSESRGLQNSAIWSCHAYLTIRTFSVTLTLTGQKHRSRCTFLKRIHSWTTGCIVWWWCHSPSVGQLNFQTPKKETFQPIHQVESSNFTCKTSLHLPCETVQGMPSSGEWTSWSSETGEASKLDGCPFRTLRKTGYSDRDCNAS